MAKNHLLLGIALLCAPSLAFAQGKNTKFTACFETTSTKPLPALLGDGEIQTKLPTPESAAQLFLAKPKTQDLRLCYGLYDTDSDAALQALSWQHEQPFESLGVSLVAFSLLRAPATLPEKKNNVKVGDVVPFSLTGANFAETISSRLPSSVRTGVVSVNKAYAFSKADAWLPAKKDALLELTRNAQILTLGQERWCEESAGCLYWEKVVVGDNHRIAYLPAGHMLFPEETIAAPNGSWKLLLRPKASLPYTPDRFNSNKGVASTKPSLVIDAWAKNADGSIDELGTYEVSAESTSALSVVFTPDGFAFQDSSSKSNLKLAAIDVKKYPTIPREEPVVTNTVIAGSQTPATKPPVAVAKAPVKKTRYHTVKSGDTLWDLSIKYGVSADNIQKANRMSKREVQNLKLGRKLVIPPA